MVREKIKIAINGCGRVGRAVLRSYMDRCGDFSNFVIAAINDPHPEEALLHLLRYDSTFGRCDADLSIVDHRLYLPEQLPINLYQQRDPGQLPWADLGIDLVLECTGKLCNGWRSTLIAACDCVCLRSLVCLP